MKKGPFFAIFLVLFVGGLIVILRSGHLSDQKVKIGVLTFVDHPVLNTIVKSFRDEMEKLGYRDGETAKFFTANAQGNLGEIEPLARSLFSQKPNVVVSVSTPVSRVLFDVAPPEQVVIYSFVTNPDDLEPALTKRSGTGVSDQINYRRSLQLVRDLLPDAKTLGIIYNPTERNSEAAMEQIKRVAPELGFKLRIESISSAQEVRSAARRLVPMIDAMFIGPDNTVVGSAPIVVEAAAETRKVVVAVDSGSVMAGAIAGYSVEYEMVGRETARLVDRKIRNPETTFDRVIPIHNDSLILNKCAANRVGIQFPAKLESKATRVIQCP